MVVPKTVGEVVAVVDGGVSGDGRPCGDLSGDPARGGQVFVLDVSTRFFKSGQATLSVASVADAKAFLAT